MIPTPLENPVIVDQEYMNCMATKMHLETVVVFVLFSIFFFQAAHAQENFVRGYIIEDGDTISGSLDYRDWDRNPQSVVFQKLGAKAERYGLNDIEGFGLWEGERYIRATADVDVSPRNLSILEHDEVLRVERKNFFAQVIFQGEKSLYSYKSPDGQENYYLGDSKGLQLLNYKKFMRKMPSGKSFLVEKRDFVHQLRDYLHPCEELHDGIRRAAYRLASLSKLFEQYYGRCSQQPYEYRRKQAKIVFGIGLQAGLSLTRPSFTSSQFDYLTNPTFSVSLDPAFAVFFDFTLRRAQGKWSIRNELLYNRYTCEGEYQLKNLGLDQEIDSQVKASYLKLNHLFRYNYPMGKYWTFVGLGISNGFALEVESSKETRTSGSISSTTSSIEAVEAVRRYEQAILLDLGIRREKYQCTVRYERGNGFSNFINLSSRTDRLYILLGYRIW